MHFGKSFNNFSCMFNEDYDTFVKTANRSSITNLIIVYQVVLFSCDTGCVLTTSGNKSIPLIKLSYWQQCITVLNQYLLKKTLHTISKVSSRQFLVKFAISFDPEGKAFGVRTLKTFDEALDLLIETSL